MKRVFLYWCVLLSALWWSGCNTDVELCRDVHPHRTLLDFQFVWDDKDFPNKPDSMHVVAIRLSNSIRYDYRITSHDTDNSGVLLYPVGEQVGDTVFDEQGNILQINNRIWARSGDYQFVAFSSHEALSVEDKEETENTETNNALTDLTFTYKPLTLEQCLKKMRLSSWQDYNPYAKYVLNEGAPIFYSVVDYFSVPIRHSTDTRRLAVIFTPNLITPRIYFEFDVEKENGVVLDSIWGEISGIPSTFDFSNNTLDLNRTYKMLFRIDYEQLPTYADSAQVFNLKNSGVISATAVVPSYSQRLTTGPGILHLAAYTHVLGEDGRKKVKIFRVCINLFNVLNQSGILVWNAQKNQYEQGSIDKDYHLRIKTPLKISKDRILNNENDNVLDNWKQVGRIDIDL